MNTNNQTKLQMYKDIQAMVQKEIDTQFPALYKKYSSEYGFAKDVPFHLHTGLDSPQIMASSLIASQGASGSITMSTTNTRYSIGLNTKPGYPFSPSNIRFNGIVVFNNNAVAPAPGPTATIRALVVGDAFLGSSFYLQPESSTAVTVGGPAQVVIQSSSYILVNDSGSGPLTQASPSEGHIISVIFNGNIVARATIPDLGDFGANANPINSGVLSVDVTLIFGWHIIGNFVIT